MPIAKKDLYDGFTLVATEGTYVSNSAVEHHGWQNDVIAGEDVVAGEDKDDAAPKGPPQKGV
jgi:hypothetical protein